jgi:hypothetical protein
LSSKTKELQQVDPGRETIPVTKKSLSCGPTLNAQLATKCELEYNLFALLKKNDIIKIKVHGANG